MIFTRQMQAPRRMQPIRATHFLGLPLYNSKSKAQLESFAHKLKNDKYAERILPRVFRSPQTFHIPVGDFIIETDDDVEAASKLLRQLDMQRILKDAATATDKINDQLDQEDQVSPLQVSCTGAETKKNDTGMEKNARFYADVHDPSDRLRGLVRGIWREYIYAGFRPFMGPKKDEEEEFWKSKALRIELAKKRKGRLMDWDAAPLFERYQNVEIARDVIIEKLSLYKKGRRRTVRVDEDGLVADEYYEEVDSIPLPQEIWYQTVTLSEGIDKLLATISTDQNFNPHVSQTLLNNNLLGRHEPK